MHGRTGEGNRVRRMRRRAVRTQREVLCDVMLAATACDAWLTLKELALLTRFGEASISAQLRHLRRRECGGFLVQKRVRDADELPRRPAQSGALWEYRLRPGAARQRSAAAQGRAA